MRLVVGVIGHVDHGKTALVRALTGMETDRLAEEKRRGISIALGFAHLTIQGTVIDLIDMPGHERFIRTMVSGATGVDAAMLVVAANEGIKPQTVEHLDIAALLGLRRVVVAVSKVDLVDPIQAEAAGAEAAALARRVGLEVRGVVLTSASAARGLDALREALRAAARDFEPLPHRLQKIAEQDGVIYVDDSKSTNPGSVVAALEAFSQPIVLIAGGKSKRTDFRAMGETIRKRTKAVVLIGEAADEIAGVVDAKKAARATSMDEAVAIARSLAVPGDVVLLSPGCASFDMFASAEARGDAFAQAANALAGARG